MTSAFTGIFVFANGQEFPIVSAVSPLMLGALGKLEPWDPTSCFIAPFPAVLYHFELAKGFDQ
jgi:hypothetical protein